MTWFTKGITIATLIVTSVTRAGAGEPGTSCAALAKIRAPRHRRHQHGGRWGAGRQTGVLQGARDGRA